MAGKTFKKGKGWTQVDIDKGMNDIVKNLIESATITTGIHEDAGNYPDGGPPVAQVAFWNEYGTENIPETNFMSKTFEKNKKNWRKEGRRIISNFFSGKQSIQKGLKRLGVIQMMAVKETVVKMRTPKNAPSTIENKGFDNRLIHTKKMLNSINYEVKWKK